MKRRLIYGMIFTVALTLGLSLGALAQESDTTVEVCLPPFTVSFNGVEIDTSDAEYPIIVYNDITYLPVEDKHTTEYNYMSHLGFVCGEDRSYSFYRKLFVRNLLFEKSIPQTIEFSKLENAGERELIAQVSENSNIIINRFGNVREVVTKEYPILIFNRREYLPMTYDIACGGLGLSMSFSADKGLEISRAHIPQPIVSVPSFDVTLNGVKYRNEIAKYPFLVYNEITYMPLADGICDFMGIEFEHNEATAEYAENVIASKKNERNEQADFDYVKDGDSFSFSLCEPYDGELYINGYGTRWHTFGMEYSPLVMGDVYYLPLTWQIAHDYLGWEYSFDMRNGLVLDVGDFSRVAEAEF